jgi:peptidoglycan/xylan/chitin deacetylase (PgdA/CDA1 family)
MARRSSGLTYAAGAAALLVGGLAANAVGVAVPAAHPRLGRPSAHARTEPVRARNRRAAASGPAAPVLRPATAGAVAAELARLTRLGLPVYCGGQRTHLVALTFDDGPGPYSQLALRILRRAGATATFFLVGKELRYWPTIPAQEAVLGALGDHTWTHPELPTLTTGAIREQLASTRAAVQAGAHARVLLFRPPYDQWNRRVLDVARALGLTTVLWSIDTRDSEGAAWYRIAANVAGYVRGGSIILMHENHGQTIEALRFRILPLLKRRHLIPVTVPQLLALDPPSPFQLAHGLAGCYGPGHPEPGPTVVGR